MNTQYAVMILSCDRHASAITQMLDETGVNNWVLLPALQARRMGYLQNVPRHRQGSMALFGSGDGPTVIRAMQTLAQAERSRDVCPDCVVLMWKVQQALMAEVALDPVCEEVVDRELAACTTYDGTPYFFCSQECLEHFNERPELYVERATMEQRVGRRTVAPCTQAPRGKTKVSNLQRQPMNQATVARKATARKNHSRT